MGSRSRTTSLGQDLLRPSPSLEDFTSGYLTNRYFRWRSGAWHLDPETGQSDSYFSSRRASYDALSVLLTTLFLCHLPSVLLTTLSLGHSRSVLLMAALLDRCVYPSLLIQLVTFCKSFWFRRKSRVAGSVLGSVESWMVRIFPH